MPVYRDWDCASEVCQALDKKLQRLPHVDAGVLLIDDGNPHGIEGWVPPSKRCALSQITALRLRRNLGHQRAICVGLCYVYSHLPCDAVLVMDADGEDRVEDAVRLIELEIAKPSTVFFAERRRRLEGTGFRIGYQLFRATHWLLTGVSVRVGNFSIVPHEALARLTCMSELWNHFAGAVFKSKLQFDCIPMDRGVRVKGRSHMNLVSLVAHGISGIATFSETVATRILISNMVGIVIIGMIFGGYLGHWVWTRHRIPGWAGYTLGILLLLFTQILWIAFSLVFSLISNRTRMEFVPIRDYEVFVEKLECLPELA